MPWQAWSAMEERLRTFRRRAVVPTNVAVGPADNMVVADFAQQPGPEVAVETAIDSVPQYGCQHIVGSV